MEEVVGEDTTMLSLQPLTRKVVWGDIPMEEGSSGGEQPSQELWGLEPQRSLLPTRTRNKESLRVRAFEDGVPLSPNLGGSPTPSVAAQFFSLGSVA